jgi:hypothetical protein
MTSHECDWRSASSDEVPLRSDGHRCEHFFEIEQIDTADLAAPFPKTA